MATKVQKMYDDLISNFPASGGGGAHTAFFSAGVLGYRAKVSEHRIYEDVTKAMPEGTRPVTNDEIMTGINSGFARAMHEDVGGDGFQRPVSLPNIPKDAFERLSIAGAGITADDIAERSPVSLKGLDGWQQGIAVLETLYNPEDTLYIGGSYEKGTPGDNIRKVSEWITYFNKTKRIRSPHIIVNPVSGERAPTKVNPDKTSYRCDNAITQWKYMVVEFDEVPIEDQLAFWAVVKLPVAALIMSGGKSVHGWVRIDCADRAEWEKEVEQDLFPGYLVPLGVDGACKNESRLSRVPGHVRKESGKLQRLLYLAPGGKAISK
jgi:hypothetical protein